MAIGDELKSARAHGLSLRALGERPGFSAISSTQGGSMLRLDVSAKTDRGMVRETNEDAARAVPRLALALVADGMGGHDHGDVASALAVGSFEAAYEQLGGSGRSVDEMLANVIAATHEVNTQMGVRRAETRSQMGTTLVVAAFGHQHVVVAHVGDSRLYRLRGRHLEALTADHSYGADLRREGRSPRMIRKYEHILTRALDGEPALEVDARALPCEIEDVYLLCSDGLWGVVPEAEIVGILAAPGTAEEACASLIRAAWDAGAGDNIGIVVIRCLAPVLLLDPSIDTPEPDVE